MVKCNSQQVSELIERNQFLERQLQDSCTIEDSLDIMDAIIINENKIKKLKGEK